MGEELGRAQEVEQQSHHFLRLLLLDPVAGAVKQVGAAPLRAGAGRHALERAGSLVDAPIALARDEGRGYVDRAAVMLRQLFENLGRAAAVPLQAALETG